MPTDRANSEWIRACADALRERWRALPARELEEVAIVIWQEAATEGEPPSEAALRWLGGVNVGQAPSRRAGP